MMLIRIEATRKVAQSCPEYSDHWYTFNTSLATQVKEWRKANTLTAVKN